MTIEEHPSNPVTLDESDSDSETGYTVTPPDSRPPSPLYPSPADALDDPNPELASSFRGMGELFFLNPAFSDVTIIVGDRSFPAHRNVICSQSRFFFLALRGGFKEAQESKITIMDETPMNIYRLLQYLYIGNYRECRTRCTDMECDSQYYAPVEERYSLRTNFTMRRLGDKYLIPGLVQKANEKILHQLKHLQDETERCKNPDADGKEGGSVEARGAEDVVEAGEEGAYNVPGGVEGDEGVEEIGEGVSGGGA
ncbi:POZ domain-containing protein [Ascobolus immersus RN42]|uniref:POZ domain-containing protein n=1 Tax=Ascobolus immersus RN42 TaxID=1160509 RepID=A0A3N4HRQ1_ASCIM|nr:POZ domain-containing protein [Ascobolus immersus RN42]